MKIAVTGAEGQLGWELCRQLPTQTVPWTRREVDLSLPEQIVARLTELQPAAVVNCGAYTQVDNAETNVELCRQVNAAAVRTLAVACQRVGCPLVQISTNYVFGKMTRPGPYVESDPPVPAGIYAQTKYEGEQFAQQLPQHIVIRTCGLYGVAPGRPNFVRSMLRLGSQRQRLSVVDDQICNPSNVVHVARAIEFLLKSRAWGVYHVANTGSVSWCEFAREVFRLRGLSTQVDPISTQDFGALAPRPADSVLCTDKYAALGGPELPDWRTALEQYLTQPGTSSPSQAVL